MNIYKNLHVADLSLSIYTIVSTLFPISFGISHMTYRINFTDRDYQKKFHYIRYKNFIKKKLIN